MEATRRKISNWANYPVTESNYFEPSSVDQYAHVIEHSGALIARGNGRSYGDASLSTNILSTLQQNTQIELDTASGILTCSAGALLEDIISEARKHKFFPPIIPGTKFITIGGAIAADVHGKNHWTKGSFYNCLISFELLAEKGVALHCSRTENEELFWNTIGGQGLTGIILSAKIRLEEQKSDYLTINEKKFASINEMISLFETSCEANDEYQVGWIKDVTSPQAAAGVFTASNHLKDTDAQFEQRADKPGKPIKVPFYLPSFAMNKWTIQAFNGMKFKKAGDLSYTQHYEQFFFPLDRILDWNKVYGKRGFLQYQFVIPEEKKGELGALLHKIFQSKFNPFLVVVKRYGAANEKSPLSFPIPGYCIAIDFKWNRKLFHFFEQLDEQIVMLGGRIYLAKDARLMADKFNQMYPKAAEYKTFLKAETQGKFQSLLSQRLNIT